MKTIKARTLVGVVFLFQTFQFSHASDLTFESARLLYENGHTPEINELWLGTTWNCKRYSPYSLPASSGMKLSFDAWDGLIVNSENFTTKLFTLTEQGWVGSTSGDGFLNWKGHAYNSYPEYSFLRLTSSHDLMIELVISKTQNRLLTSISNPAFNLEAYLHCSKQDRTHFENLKIIPESFHSSIPLSPPLSPSVSPTLETLRELFRSGSVPEVSQLFLGKNWKCYTQSTVYGPGNDLHTQVTAHTFQFHHAELYSFNNSGDWEIPNFRVKSDVGLVGLSTNGSRSILRITPQGHLIGEFDNVGAYTICEVTP